MSYFIDKGYLYEGDKVTESSVELTEEEYLAYQQEARTASILAKRDSLISAVEWRRSRYRDEVALGLPPTEPLLPILRYIQALRDITKQTGYPANVVWPAIP